MYIEQDNNQKALWQMNQITAPQQLDNIKLHIIKQHHNKQAQEPHHKVCVTVEKEQDRKSQSTTCSLDSGNEKKTSSVPLFNRLS